MELDEQIQQQQDEQLRMETSLRYLHDLWKAGFYRQATWFASESGLSGEFAREILGARRAA